jgi:hypothetical protein
MKNSQKQFVIQQHTTPDGVHWDLMLEMDDTLWTWRLHVPPAEIKNKPICAERIHNHPLRFLTYEGAVQNNTGHVTIADNGTYRMIKQSHTMLVVSIEGRTLSGTFEFCLKSKDAHWSLEKAQGI